MDEPQPEAAEPQPAPSPRAEQSNEEDDAIATEEQLSSQGLGDVGTWIVKTLQECQPDAEITMGSVKVRFD